MDTGIKQPAIKSLLGCKTLEKFTIKRATETQQQKKQRQKERNYCVSRYVEVKHLHNRHNNVLFYWEIGEDKSNVFSVAFKGTERKKLNYH